MSQPGRESMSSAVRGRQRSGKLRPLRSVAVAARHHLIVDGEDEPLVARRRGAAQRIPP